MAETLYKISIVGEEPEAKDLEVKENKKAIMISPVPKKPLAS